jgi:hypothetical protein
VQELVASSLLMDVNTISRISQPTVRTRHHKFQILLRCEVHWLLANRYGCSCSRSCSSVKFIGF